MNIIEQYYDWLLKNFCGRTDKYSSLLGFLFDTDFEWVLDFDENRASDGIYLRYVFRTNHEMEHEDDLEFTRWEEETPCSVLEMLCALSKRAEDYLGCDLGRAEEPERWFWLMLDNCGLADLDDACWYEPKAKDILEIVLKRKYHRDGTGGLWPLINSAKDQRKVDLWYQANFWFTQNRDNM